MNKIIFATNNQHKVDEIRQVLGNRFEIITLEEAGINIDIPEPHDSLEANAREKSSTIFLLTGQDCFAEDTGLEVAALNGEPGVKSARYSGEERSFSANIEKLLRNMSGQENRRARFRTVISLIMDQQDVQFQGVCEGIITREQRGTNGFGYDPVFIPSGADLTFAEMDTSEKNAFSHRRKAMDKLILYLQSRYLT